jgi:outer membrane protein assembly factor BamB
MNFAHSTPVLATINGVEQLVVMVSKGIQGIDPATGKVLWQAPGSGDTTSPAIGGTLVYSDGGRGGAGIGVDLADWKPGDAVAKDRNERAGELKQRYRGRQCSSHSSRIPAS